jgi:hypothetical protein
VLRRLFAGHSASVLSVLAATTILAKVWAVAHGNAVAISALVSTGGLTSLLGALLAGLPAIGTACMLVVGALLPEAIREGDDLRGPITGTIVALLVGLALATERWFYLGLVWLFGMTVSSFAIIALRRAWRRTSARPLPFMLRKSEYPQNAHPVVAVGLLLIIGWCAAAVSDRHWLPPEEVATSAGVVTGYVLDDSDGLLLMKDSNRSIVRIPRSNVVRRAVCITDASSPTSLLSRVLWGSGHSYPPCNEH